MSNTSMYKASLDEETVQRTKSYEIKNLFYVAFFGGVIALSVLATKNAKWLHVKQQVVKSLIFIAVLVFIGKLGLFYGFFHDLIDLERQTVKFLARAVDLLVFGGYYLVLLKPYKKHLVMVSEIESMKKDAIIWCLIAIGIEAVFIGAVAAL